MAQTVKDFVSDSYQIISAGSPTVPLYGNDMLKGVQFLNELLQSFSGTGLLTPISQEITYNLSIGQRFITFADPSFTPPADVQNGRLANCENVWLLLDGVTYPNVEVLRNVFFDSYKYDPQVGLPRFAIIYNNTNFTTMRLYPAPSELFELHVFGKFELPILTENSDMSILPDYMIRFLKLATAKDLARYKGRMAAWTGDLKNDLLEARQEIESISSVNVIVNSENDSYLNGSWRVRAGV